MNEPIVDWIGSVPITHGERDDDSGMCLCGFDPYFACPDFIAGIGTIFQLQIEGKS